MIFSSWQMSSYLMACFTPNQGYEARGLTKNGKFAFTYDSDRARRCNGIPVRRVVPCRKCEGCRYDHSREWAVKIVHEASLYENGSNNSFITLTYNDDYIPLYGSLSYDLHWTKFVKRLRLALAPLKIRFFMVGEYGDLNLRPHYHAIIFGYSFPDKYVYEVHNGNPLYRSPLLESIWTPPYAKEGVVYGHSSVGAVTAASAAYVARYNMKKVIGHDIDGRYDRVEIIDHETGECLYVPKICTRVNQETGDLITVAPEKNRMSNRSGIGKKWFDQYALTDMYLRLPDGSFKDSVHLSDGLSVRPPKYYDKLLSDLDPQLMDDIKKSRVDHISKHADHFTPERLAARREVLQAKLTKLKRNVRRVYDQESVCNL